MKKLFTVALAFALAVSAVFAGGSKETKTGGGKPVEITMWVYSDLTTGITGEMFNRWAQEFTAANPDVSKITFIGKNDTELLTGLMAGVGLPDCFTASFRDGKTYAEALDYLNLKPYFDRQETAWRDSFDAKAIAAATEGDQMYSIPFIGYAPLLFRNISVLRESGIDPSQGTPTWDLFIEQLRKIKAAGLDATHTWAGDWFPAGAILAAEESLTIGVRNGRTTITTTQLLPVMEMFLKLKPYCSNMVWSDEVASEAFKTNKLGFLIGGPWQAEGFDNSGVDYDIVPIPAFKAGGRTGGLRGIDGLYGVNGNKNDAVFRWLKYMTGYERMLEYLLKMGRPVLNERVMTSPEVAKNPRIAVNAVALKGGIDQTDFFRTTAFWPSPIGDISALVDSGRLTPQQAAEEMIKRINALYAEAE
jgi:multiple sugar transport system substrate-binding protein